MTERTVPWWKSGVIYQIYPRSFQDSDGDGVGDLRGIRARLRHLTELGVDAIWISPIYASPMEDFGYDVEDYTAIEPMFGSMADFEALVAAVHGAGMKLLLDFVPSHSSDRHPWFVESRASRESDKRDWYVWRDAAPGGGPPSNWLSEFGGPAWTWDSATEQYYLNIYLSEQPALNWRHPPVRDAMYDVMRFWFDRGVDGFRIDGAEHLAPDDRLRDNLVNPDWEPSLGPARQHFRTFTSHQPAVFEIVREMREVAEAYDPARLLVGEAYGTLDEVMRYYGEGGDGFQLPFNFALIEAEWTAQNLARIITDYEAALPAGAWPNWVLGNHDRPRIASRVGAAQARVAAMLLLTLRGTPTIYQGDELGLPSGEVPPDAVQDPWEKNVPGEGLGRDPVRTPMPWTAEAPGHGFTYGTPWLPITVGPDGPAAAQAGADDSMLELYRDLLALRRSEPALSLGALRSVRAAKGVLRYDRVAADGRTLAVALNTTGSRVQVVPGDLVMSTVPGRRDFDGDLGPDEGVVLI